MKQLPVNTMPKCEFNFVFKQYQIHKCRCVLDKSHVSELQLKISKTFDENISKKEVP